jgi:predicted enzyme related to lactoylglutathione lyase
LEWPIELIVVPVEDIDRAKAFYRDGLGWNEDVDFSNGPDFRVVQLTPPGSGCSVALMRNQPMAPGTLHGVQISVADIEAARAELVGRGVEASEFFHFGEAGQTAGLHPTREKYATFFSLADPDGNTITVQEVNRSDE